MLEEAKAYLKTREKVNLAMAVINIIVFVVMEIMGSTESSRFMLDHGAAYTPLILQGEYWRLFTSMFLHFGATHLAMNMICLITIGDMLERMAGHWKYLLIYLGSGLAGNLLSVAVEEFSGDYALSAGASGAIFGVIGAVFVVILKNRDRFRQDYIRRYAIMIALMIMEGFVVSGIDNNAHIGGVVAGAVLSFILCRGKIGRDLRLHRDGGWH